MSQNRTVRARFLLLCVGSPTERQRAAVPGDTVTAMIAKALWCDVIGRLTLTDSGRAALRARLPGL